MIKVLQVLVWIWISSTILNGQENQGKSLDFLLGDWVCTNGSSNTTTLETWRKNGKGGYLSQSMVLQDTDTIYVENVVVELEGSHYYYKSTVPQNVTPIKFKIIDKSTDGFIAVNRAHDFPQEILYRKKDKDHFIATVKDSLRTIIYHFERRK